MAHNIELIAPQIGLVTPCAKGVWINSSQAVLKLNGGTVKASVQPVFNNSTNDGSIIGTDLVGGSQHSFIQTNVAGVQRFIGNTVRSNAGPSGYSLLFAGTGEPIIIGNEMLGNTSNVLRCLTRAVQVGNRGLVVDGVASSGGVVKRSTTANRPVPTSADAGLLFLDTTLAAPGKPIWATGVGSTYVDATGWDQSVAAPTYSVTNSVLRSYDKSTVTLPQLADALGTLISDLRARGFVS